VRASELDSVRGIAAFVVVLHHFWETVLPDQNTFPFLGNPIAGTGWFAELALWISLSPLRLLFSGHAAVGVFFVLSGFALTKALENPANASFGPFMIRRFFRIYPPFALVVLIAAALCWLIQPQPIIGREWVNLSWSEPVTLDLVVGHLSMISTAGEYNSLNSPMWTLVHELRISFVFVFLAPLVIAFPRAACAAALGTFTLLSIRHFTMLIAGFLPEGLSRDVLLSFMQTARYVLFFVFGILIASKYSTFARLLDDRPHVARAGWLIAFALLAVPYTKGYLELCYAVGALMLIVLCLHSAVARRFLNRPVFLWLGKVSYSLYLSHQVILIALVYLLHDTLPMIAILPLVLIASLLAAEFLNRTVELPSSELGKRLSRSNSPVAGRATS
jgi:peptidoglycan/LPS O-acetylase OafA/YrhL